MNRYRRRQDYSGLAGTLRVCNFEAAQQSGRLPPESDSNDKHQTVTTDREIQDVQDEISAHLEIEHTKRT
jgi:hypothetical protein